MKSNVLFAGFISGLCLAAQLAIVAAPSLSIQQLPAGQIQITWPGDTAGFSLEQAANLNAPVPWGAVSETIVNAGGVFSVTIPPATQTRFYRLRGAFISSVLETSPAHGESGVAVTRETIFRLSAPLAPGTTVTTGQLFAEFGGRRLLSRAELSSDRLTVTLFYLENLPASARVRVTLLGDGLKDAGGTGLDADSDGQAGGTQVLQFDTASISALPSTVVIGRVFASELGPSGTNRPLAGVTVTVDGAEESLRTVTDVNGSFRLQPAPAGRFFVHVDGRTAVGSQWPGGAYYPFVGKAWEAVPGRTNNLAGGSGEIFLPLIQADALKTVSATEATRITFVPSVLAANPALAGVEIMVPANSLFSDNGTRGGKVGMAPVPPDRLPEPLPPGLNFPLVITIQTDGGSNFDLPVPVKFPNLPDPVTGLKLGPGEKSVLWSFNHDTGHWEPQGTMTVSADGNFAVSDPGVGIRQPGWHGQAPGSPGGSGGGGGGCPNCPKNCDELKLKAEFATADCALDGVLAVVSGAPVVGCAIGAAVNSWKVARDCLFLDLDECYPSFLNNAVNTGAGCVPIYGSAILAVNTTLCTAGAAQAINDYKACIGGPAASLQSFVGKAAGSVDPIIFAKFQEAIRLFEVQLEVNTALRNLGIAILGSPVWSAAEFQSANNALPNFFLQFAAALGAGSPGGINVTPEERAGLLALPRPAGVNASDVLALMDRFQGLSNGGLKLAANRLPLIQAYDNVLSAAAKVQTEGWKSLFEGSHRALAILSDLFEPRSPGLYYVTFGNGIQSFPPGQHHYALVNLETGFTQRGRLNSQTRLENVILAPETHYLIAYLMGEPTQDPFPAFKTPPYFGMAVFKSSGTGLPTRILYAPMLEDHGVDTDLDGLSDHAEFVLGTSVYNTDADGDGILDGQEVFSGTNPLDGVGLPLGVIAVAPTLGSAVDVAAGNGLAVTAATGGLAVFDVSNPQNPVQTAVVPGNVDAVALRGSLAVAAFDSNVRLLDLALPSTPVTLWSRNDFSNSDAVGFGRNSVFVVKGTTLHRLELTSGITTGSLILPVTATGILARGDIVYLLGPSTLAVCRDEDVLGLEAAVPSPGSGGIYRQRLALGGPFLYGSRVDGINVFDLSDPALPALVRSHSPGQVGWRHLVPISAGLALGAVGANSTPNDPARDVSVYNLNPGGTSLVFVATFPTPGSAEALAVAGARAFVADFASGLAVVNYLSPDLAGIPPTIALDLDSLSVPPQVEGNALVRLGARAEDDIAVRHVEFFINGTLESRDDSYPFEVFYRTPAVSPSTKNFTLRLRAVDTAGNVTETPELTVGIVLDATPPKIAALDPAPGSSIPANVVTEVIVSFLEPVVTPVSTSTLSVVGSGPDGRLDTQDDIALSGIVQYDNASRSIIFSANAPLPTGQFRATLAAGLADAAGNGRSRPLAWEFKTGPDPRVASVFPPSNFVRVGGTLDELSFTFDQPLPKASAATYVFEVFHRVVDGLFTRVTPISVQLSVDRRTTSLRTTGVFLPGEYRVTGSGPFVQPMLWEFRFRDVPNEALSTSIGVPVGLLTNWKYFPGPGVNDELIINLPGQIAPLDIRAIKSISAHTDIRFLRQTINVLEPIQALAGLEIANSRFEAGVTHVHGPIVFYAVFAGEPTVIGPHIINAYGGGYIRSGDLRFPDPNGALVNHPGSTLVLSNGAGIFNTGTVSSNAGRIVNLGTLRSLGEDVRLEDVRLRNDGRIETAAGSLKIFNLENEGEIDVAAGAKLILAQRTRGGVSSKITGAGAVEFGEYNASTRRVVSSAEAELRGEFETTGPVTLVAGNVTFWRPLLRPAVPLTLQNGGVMRLFAPSRLGAVSLESGELVLNGDSEIASVINLGNSSIEVATRSRVTGEARLGRATFLGLGVMEFAGLTIVSNGTQVAVVNIRDGTVRNTGRWLQAGGGTQGSSIVPSANGTLGVFENAGEFEQTTARPFAVQTPFRNAGRAVFSSGTVSFDARSGFNPAHRGVYLPQPGGELVLNGTPVEHNNGVLDLATGVLRGTGSIQAIGSNPSPRVINRAVLRPGNPTGDLTIRATDGFEQTATGELVITLASTATSRLVLSSTAATLAGMLRVELADGFSPNIGQTFNVVTFTSRTGEFGNVVLPNLGLGKKLELVYSATAVTVRVVAAP